MCQMKVHVEQILLFVAIQEAPQQTVQGMATQLATPNQDVEVHLIQQQEYVLV